jgi:hypothetical protein
MASTVSLPPYSAAAMARPGNDARARSRSRSAVVVLAMLFTRTVYMQNVGAQGLQAGVQVRRVRSRVSFSGRVPTVMRSTLARCVSVPR